MNTRLLVYIITAAMVVSLIGTGCKTEQQATTNVYKVDTTDSQKIRSGLVYGLPKTQLSFQVELKRNITMPGPYHEYGEKLLGLSNVPHSKQIRWDIAGINIKESGVMDYDHLYAVEPRGRFSIDWSRFTRKGWIIPFDESVQMTVDPDFYSGRDYDNKILYKDLSVKKFVGEETKTVYERVWKDSLFARVPVEKTEVVQKDKPEKAQEAANFIFIIRSRRFELISGMGDYYPDGKALETAVNEMNRLEEQYLSLFTGKKMTDTVQYTLRWTPDSVNLEEPEMLFRFSQNRGILKPDQQQGTPVWLELELTQDPSKLSRSLRDKFAASNRPQFFYRLPVDATLRLKFGDSLMAKKYIELYQLGPVLQIPYQFLMDSRIMEFFPESLTEDENPRNPAQ